MISAWTSQARCALLLLLPHPPLSRNMDKFIQIANMYTPAHTGTRMWSGLSLAVVCGLEVLNAAGLPVSFDLHALGLANDESPVIAGRSGAFR
jgi:hypothetical protein